ncbi:DUF4240 domain-containing protein [Paractinoplanes rishiriensis]|uniref:DUF4240 domain-containing protein n=1 Tax=Paractinoplanes rishiriensis TaxID=1050105 RepID=A0A919JVF8_9ACTN|nr:DUF4240 domain-containing protein [Actinoplanes rishiriensis]GIE94047.1 hypothetical protein Ari01nite_15120 [Actinoplanes rishiriensis]
MIQFWELIEESAGHRDRTDWIAWRLNSMAAPEIVGFEVGLIEARRQAETWTMYGAACRIMSGLCSMDGFWYFLPWLTGLGKSTFELVALEPDVLAEVPEVRRLAELTMDRWTDDDWPQWEDLNYAGRGAYDAVTGEDEGILDALAALGYAYPEDPEPTGERWDFDDDAEMVRRLPRLSALFPLTR